MYVTPRRLGFWIHSTIREFRLVLTATYSFFVCQSCDLRNILQLHKIMNTGSFDQLCGHLGMDPSGDPLSNIQELMNFSLQCLGGIRILFQSLEKQRNSTMLKSLDDISHWQDLGVQYWSMKKVFQDSLLRMMQAIMVSDEQSIDPCRHIVESFPNGSTIGKQNWMAAHWAVLGDPEAYVRRVSQTGTIFPFTDRKDDLIFVAVDLICERMVLPSNKLTIHASTKFLHEDFCASGCRPPGSVLRPQFSTIV